MTLEPGPWRSRVGSASKIHYTLHSKMKNKTEQLVEDTGVKSTATCTVAL